MNKIAIVTGTRAEYGLLKPLIKSVYDDKKLELFLLVTGMHLMPEFGNTYEQIEADGFPIYAKIEDGLNGDSSYAITNSIAQAMKGFAQVLENLKPDILIVLGDRTEILAAAIAAMISNTPIAHIHGGETTEGAYDEYIRHSITKMSYLHFTAAEVYRKRVIQLGESPDRVFNVGAIGIDSIMSLKLLDRKEFEHSINFKLSEKNVLITFHPVTLENNSSEMQFGELLNSINKLESTTLIFTKPNSDKGGRIIGQMIDDYVAQNQQKAISFTSLGQLRYISALQFVDFVIGNSSSGIYEAPIFNIPTINIGDRQKGRIMQDSVINCEPLTAQIDSAISKALDQHFLKLIKKQKKIFGDGTAAPQILSVLKSYGTLGLQKPFYDIKFD